MLKNLLRMPTTFDPDDRRRRQVLNIMLLILIFTAILLIVATLFFYDYRYSNSPHGQPLIAIMGFGAVIFAVLLLANRWPRLPGWVSALAFEIFLLLIMSQADTPFELYNGRSLVIWTLPIVISAIILRPWFVFIIAAAVFGLMQAFTPASAGGINFYAMSAILIVAIVSWLGMRIANQAIRDARRHAANLEAIFNSVAEGVLVLDPRGNIISVNPALLKMFSEDDLKEICAEPLGKTLTWKHKIFSITTSPIPQMGLVAIFRDETRRHETERARDALIAVASHELRTPLTAIMNYLELLLVLSKQGRVKTNELNEHLTRALENCKRLQSLVNDMLDQAQIQAGALILKHEPFDLRALLHKTHLLLESMIAKKNLAYEQVIGPDVPAEITSDPQRLQQVLVNLLGNAVKFTDRGSIKVDVSVPHPDELCIRVTDSGPGIPPEQLPDIFEAFRRGSDYAQRERQGAGLGLSIVKEIVNRMGGEIRVASEMGMGSSFVVSLPVKAV